jgi:hypothetical protein
MVSNMDLEPIFSFRYYTEEDVARGTWDDLQDQQVSFGGYEELLIPWYQSPRLDTLLADLTLYGEGRTLSEEETLSMLQQAGELTIYIYHAHSSHIIRTRSGFFTWGRYPSKVVWLHLEIDTGSGIYSATGPRLYQQTPGSYEQAAGRRKLLIPAGIHPSFVWVLLIYLGLAAAAAIYDWRLEPFQAHIRTSERILDGPVVEGDWAELEGQTIDLPKYQYKSPPLAELLADGKMSGRTRIVTYIVEQHRVREVCSASGLAVWARARDLQVSLMLVVESGGRRFTAEKMPEVYRKTDPEFNDPNKLTQMALKRQTWLPVGLRWP